MSDPMQPPPLRRLDPLTMLAVAATVLAWGGSYTAIRVALAALTPAEIAVLRYFAAAVVGAAFLAAARTRLPNRAEFVRLAVVGILYVVGFAVLLNLGQQTVSAGTASFVVGTLPVMIAIMASIALGEPFGRLSWFGALVSLTGIGLIAFGSGNAFTLEFGVFLVLGAALAAAAASIVQKSLLADFSSLVLTSWILTLGVVPLLPVLPRAVEVLVAAAAEVKWAVAFLAIASTIVGYVGWSVVLRRMPAGRAATFLNCVPLAATATGFFWLGEVPTMAGFVGGLMALTGVVIVNAARGR
jgi:drug/metabolite transporter (DMT)-like permease